MQLLYYSVVKRIHTCIYKVYFRFNRLNYIVYTATQSQLLSQDARKRRKITKKKSKTIVFYSHILVKIVLKLFKVKIFGR